MRTYQEFITEIRRYNLRRRGGDPFTHSGGYKPLKPLDLSAIHKMSDDAAKSSEEARKQREKKNKQFDTRRRMDAAGKKLGLPEEFVDPEHGEAPSGRSPLQNVSDHPKASVRKKAVKGFRKQMEKEYGGKWTSRSNDPVREENDLEEGMTMKDFKANRKKLRRKEASVDAERRGHVGKEWYNSGRKYSPDEAKRMRSKLDDEERSTRHRSSIDPEGDDSNYSADKTKNPKKIRKQKAMGELGEEYIDETSLTRVMSKSKKGGMAIMSAQRGDKSSSENKARSRQLEKDIRGAGLPGPTKVAGRYTENPGTPQEKKVGEKSHIITPGKKGKRAFKKAIEKLGKKYDQDSVLIQRKGGGEATLKGTSKTSWPGKGKNVKIGGMKPGRTGEFDTKVKNKTFTVEH